MKTTFLLYLFTLTTAICTAQIDTEIYLFDINKKGESIILTNQKNISDSEGYDSQPYFLANNALLYAGTVKGNTEIIQYTRGKKRVFNTNTRGGEYSPQTIPGGRAISAVRLDTTGYQRLYKYSPRDPISIELIKDAKVAYYTWADKNTIVSADIVGQNLELVIHNIENKTSENLGIKVGRSFHKIPNTSLISFVDKTSENWALKSLNSKTKKIKEITSLIKGAEDIAWLPNGSLLITKENSIYIKKDMKSNWEKLHTFDDENLKNLSRIAVSPDGSQIAVVSEISPGEIVQKHIKPFNNRDLDAFANAFSENVVVRNYFSDTLYVGRDLLKDKYRIYFENTKSSTVKVVNRIIHKNKVIDHELVTVEGKQYNQATIYTVDNGKISSMTFIKPSKNGINPVPTVEAQLKTYNKGDIDGFLSFYDENIKLYTYPTIVSLSNQEDIKTTYGGLFKRIPDLNAKIKNRITIGNYTIDHEELSSQGNTWYGVAINKVINNKITQVTFL